VTASEPKRLLGLDAFRGFTMVMMIAEGFGLRYVRDWPGLGPVAAQFTHIDWNFHGWEMHFWDLIQPFFMFIVGVVMPVSFARRWAAGETWQKSLWHVLRRSALLILWGLIARSVHANRPVVDLINVLAQIAFTYLVAFLVLRKPWQTQLGFAFGLLAVHWALFEFAVAPGVAGPWVKDANIGWFLDKALLGKNWGGSYATINCLSSAANTVFGVVAGQLLGAKMDEARKLRVLVLVGVAAVLAGSLMDFGVPLNKKIWTASFAVFSTGWTLLALALFHWVCDIRGKVAWARLFLMVGANSIFIYLFHEILGGWLGRTTLIFMWWSVDLWGPVGRMLNSMVAIGLQCALCVWLYRRRIFFKL
jgi:predicted acyltransferase